MIAAPALLVASTVAYTAGGGLGEDQAGGVIQVYAMAAFALTVVGLARILADSSPRAAAALMLVGVIGTAGGAGWGINSIYTAVGSVDINEDVAGAAGPLALQLPGLLFPLTFVALGVMLARANAVPRACAIALALAGVLFPLSRIPSVEILALVADTLFLGALVPLGWAMLQGRDAVAAPRSHELEGSATVATS